MKNKTNLNVYKNRLPLLSWLIFPVFFIWLATSYLVGLNRQTEWQKNAGSPKVVHSYAENPQIKPLKWDNTGLVTLWFDDAWYSQYAIGLPVLESNNFVGALAVPTDLVNGESYMTWPQVQRMQHKGWEIDSHSRTHTCNIDSLDDKKIKSEISESLDILREHNLYVQNYVTPCGESNKKIINEIKQNYLSLRTTDDGLNEIPVKDPYSLKIYAIERTTTIADVRAWIRQAKTEKTWLIIVFHQIGDGNDEYEVSSDRFKQIIEEVKKSQLPVVLPTQVLNIEI